MGKFSGRGNQGKRVRSRYRAGKFKRANFLRFVPEFPDAHIEQGNLDFHKSNDNNYSQMKKPEVIEKMRKPFAIIDESKCTGCGACEEACPLGAIIVDAFASVNSLLCTGCGICSSICPVDAITIL